MPYRTLVMLFSDGYLINGSESWLILDLEKPSDLRVQFASGFGLGARAVSSGASTPAT